MLSDRIDEWMMSYLTEFEGKAFQSVSKADDSLNKLADEENPEQQEAEKALEPFVERVKTLLGERVKDVRLTHRLTDTPAIVTTDADEMSTQMAKLFAAAGQQAPEVKYIFELNPDHGLVKRAAEVTDDTQFAQWVELLLDQALLAENIGRPNQFIRRMNQLLTAIDKNTLVQRIAKGVFYCTSDLNLYFIISFPQISCQPTSRALSQPPENGMVACFPQFLFI